MGLSTSLLHEARRLFTFTLYCRAGRTRGGGGAAATGEEEESTGGEGDRAGVSAEEGED